MRRVLPDFGCWSREKVKIWQYTGAYTFFFVVALQPKSGLGRLVLRILDHTKLDTHPIGLLWTKDKLDVEAATYTTHNKHNRRTSKPSTGFEPATPAIKRPKTYARHIHTYTIYTVYIRPRWEIRVKFPFENLKGWDLGRTLVDRISNWC